MNVPEAFLLALLASFALPSAGFVLLMLLPWIVLLLGLERRRIGEKVQRAHQAGSPPTVNRPIKE